MSKATVVLGAQWGDEGKGKIVDMLGGEFDVVARAQGGSNAGHTIVVDGVKYAFHLLPSGLLNPGAACVIGNGVVVHLPSLFRELDAIEAQGVSTKGRLFISDRAHLLFDLHQIIDGLKEQELEGGKLGTTKRGVGPCYSSKASRGGIRVGDLVTFKDFPAKFQRMVEAKWKRFGKFDYDVAAELERYQEYAERVRPMIIDSVHYLSGALKDNKKVLVEGANATMLDIDFGTYPFVTSSNASVGGVCTGLGLPPTKIGTVVGVVKAYTTRVGAGPFPTELEGELGERLANIGHEVGTTTGRGRRCGWFDAVVVKYSHIVNDFTSINLTKLDVLSEFDELKIAASYSYKGTKLESFPASLEVLADVEVEYMTLPGWKTNISSVRTFEDLPPAAQTYVKTIEGLVGVPAKYIGVGPGRDEMIVRTDV